MTHPELPRRSEPLSRTAATGPVHTGSGDETIARLRGMATLLDRAFAIPGTRIRVGLDPILGLIPGGGDVVTGLFSAYLVAQAARLGVPRATLYRMIGNVVVDTAVGAIPLLGDLFDVAWRANSRNVEMLASHVAAPAAARRQSRMVVAGAVALVLGIVALGLVATVALVRWLSSLL